ncbi:hypothetical protein [Schlesneria sp. DSM 10557]|uniref:hypothetical protein n=1 Tax=Schlesneria sp. DSM 10557 TaxID=3044399 RepID=UPI0035A0E7DB
MWSSADDAGNATGTSTACGATAEVDAVITNPEPLTRRRKPIYLPTPAEIEAECARIRREWSHGERITRRMRGAHDLEPECHETHESTRDRSCTTSFSVRESDAEGRTVPSHQPDGLFGGTDAGPAGIDSSLCNVS